MNSPSRRSSVSMRSHGCTCRALPALARTATGSGRTPAQAPANSAPRLAAQPAFRLFELRSGHPQTSPPPPVYRTGPRIRFLDADHVPDIHEYETHPDDILPAKSLIRRLIALDHAMDHRGLYINRIRRSLGRVGPLLAQTRKRLFRPGPFTRLQCETARLVAAETHAIQPYFNSS